MIWPSWAWLASVGSRATCLLLSADRSQGQGLSANSSELADVIERGGQGATPAASYGISALRPPTTFPSRAVGPTDACVSALPSATPDDFPRRRLSQSHQLLFKDPRCRLDHFAPIASATPVCAPLGANPAFASCRLRPRIAGPWVSRGVLLRCVY